ncbi:spermidine/putrescine ABC transporter substrate-binding protein [Ammoniphilus oxalaticus]|uniref:Spermidine/putrescine ABC transporter substrate-binding protein n=1 Tax=Ammoniphilus oxalaticus TaxID=66863 RepID=A0A419SH71_9BACL|nr:spermidine/putrescine ABC transporter substrate-binding protein [Ammoniphilus oxalaticus]
MNKAQTVNTICSFCGTGCGLSVQVEAGRITRVRGQKENPSSHGETCVKGSLGWRYVYSDRRLTEPLVRKDGKLVPVSWEEALSVIADRFSSIKAKHGPDVLGCFSSSRSTNELNYLAQKFMRAVIGSNNVDSCNRT